MITNTIFEFSINGKTVKLTQLGCDTELSFEANKLTMHAMVLRAIARNVNEHDFEIRKNCAIQALNQAANSSEENLGHILDRFFK